MSTIAAAAGARRHTGTYPTEPGQVRLARAGLACWLGDCTRADDAVLVASEFVTNAVLHSASRNGGAFVLRSEVRQDDLRIEVEDAGGPWRDGPRDGGRPHGFDVVAAVAGPGELECRRGRPRTRRLGQARRVIRVAVLPPPGDASRVSSFLADHPRWSFYWDKKHGLWRVAEDDPDSDLYAESRDADTVISYITEHSIVDR